MHRRAAQPDQDRGDSTPGAVEECTGMLTLTRARSHEHAHGPQARVGGWTRRLDAGRETGAKVEVTRRPFKPLSHLLIQQAHSGALRRDSLVGVAIEVDRCDALRRTSAQSYIISGLDAQTPPSSVASLRLLVGRHSTTSIQQLLLQYLGRTYCTHYTATRRRQYCMFVQTVPASRE